MGKYPRPKQARLAEKLLQIRTTLNLSQNEMLRHLGLDENLYHTSISNYELNRNLQHSYTHAVCNFRAAAS